MLFYSFFKSLVGKEVTVELKNDLGITGHLHSVDQYLNIKLQDIYVTCPGNGLNTKVFSLKRDALHHGPDFTLQLNVKI